MSGRGRGRGTQRGAGGNSGRGRGAASGRGAAACGSNDKKQPSAGQNRGAAADNRRGGVAIARGSGSTPQAGASRGKGSPPKLPVVRVYHKSEEGIPKEPPYTIKVNNVSERIHKKNLVAAFQSYGEITDIYIPRDNERRKGFGYAFVRFRELEAARRAIAGANGQIVKNRQMILEWSTKHPTVPPLATVHKLPEDVLKRIFEYLRWDSLARVGHVNRKWRKISLDVWNKFKVLALVLQSLTMYDRFSVRHKLTPLVEQHGRTLESICFKRTKVGQLALSRVGRCCPNLKTMELLDVAIFKPRPPTVNVAHDSCLNYLREIFVEGMPGVVTLVLHKLNIAFFASPTAERRTNRGLAIDELLFLPHMRSVQRLMLSKVPLSNTVLQDLTRNLSNTLTCLILKNNGNHLTAAQIYSGIQQLTNLLELTVDLDVLRLNANAHPPFAGGALPAPDPIAQPFIGGLVETNTSLQFLCLMRATIRKDDVIQLLKSLPQLKFLFLLKCNTINDAVQGFTPPNIISALKQRPLANANNPLLFFCDEQAGLGGEEITEFNAANRNLGDTVHLFVGGLEKFRCLTAAALTEQKAMLKEATDRWSYATMLKSLQVGVMFGETFSGWSIKNTRHRRCPFVDSENEEDEIVNPVAAAPQPANAEEHESVQLSSDEEDDDDNMSE